MKLKYDKNYFTGKYDERNLTISKSGKYKYPSKKMFVEFLKQYKDIDAIVDIWSVDDIPTGKVKIHIELEYKVKNLKSQNSK